MITVPDKITTPANTSTRLVASPVNGRVGPSSVVVERPGSGVVVVLPAPSPSPFPGRPGSSVVVVVVVVVVPPSPPPFPLFGTYG